MNGAESEVIAHVPAVNGGPKPLRGKRPEGGWIQVSYFQNRPASWGATDRALPKATVESDTTARSPASSIALQSHSWGFPRSGLGPPFTAGKTVNGREPEFLPVLVSEAKIRAW